MSASGAATLYAAIIGVCYAPVLFGGKTLQAPLYTRSAVVPETPLSGVGRSPFNTFDVDLATPAFYEWPLDRFIGQTLRHGELPLWNPHQAAGTPVVADYSTRVFFPYQMLIDVSPPSLWDFWFVLRLWIAGWLTYCFLARAGLGFAAAALGGLSYMLSGAFTWFVNLEQLVNAAMVIPLLFLAVEAIVATPDSRRAAWAACALGLNLLAGQPEITLYAVLAAGLYGIARWLGGADRSRRRLRRLTGWTAVAILVGLGVAAPLLAPFAAHLPVAFHLHEGGSHMGIRDPAPPVLGIALFVPTFFQLPTAVRVKPDNGRWDFLGGYGGVLAVFLAIAGILVPKWTTAPSARAALILFVGVWSWIALKNFGVHPFDWIGRLPLLSQVWTPRWAGPTSCFALSSGAAFGLARLQEANDRSPAARAWLLLALMVVLLGVAILGVIATAYLEPALGALWVLVWPGALGGQVVAATILTLATLALIRLEGVSLATAVLGIMAVERWFPIPGAYAPIPLALRLALVGLGLSAIGLFVLRRRLLAGSCAAVALAAAVLLGLSAPFGLPERRDPAAEPPVVRFLKARGGYDRIMGDSRVIAPNYASVFGLYDVRYVNALAVDWFQRFAAEGLETSPPQWWHALWFTGDPAPSIEDGRLVPGSLERDVRERLRGYSLLSARYFLVPPGMDLNARAKRDDERFPIVYRDEVIVYENRAALPRAFVVGEWESAMGAAEARARALTGLFGLRNHAVVENAPPGAGGGRGAAEIVAYGANSVTIDAAASARALVVLTDTFYPGWRATVDGMSAPIYRVDGIVRGVFVEAGHHRVVMRFSPPSQTVGFLIGAAALLAVAALAVRGQG